MVFGNGPVLISRVDVMLVLPPNRLVYLSGRRCTARGGRWPSTECQCRMFKSQKSTERDRDKMVLVRTSTRLSRNMLVMSCTRDYINCYRNFI